MSNPIQNYYRKLDDLRRIAGADNEGALRFAFQGLLETIGNDHQLILYNEYPFKSPSGTTLRADGVLVDRLRLVHGRGVAIFAKDFWVSYPKISKNYATAMPSAAPAVLVTRSLPNKG